MNISLILFVLFVGVPILEIAAFIKIGEAIGVVPTLLGCVVTAVIGAWLVRLQGFGVLRDAQMALSRNQLPVEHLAHGALILVAGVLLMTPGYVTDAMGFLLLVPPVRLQVAHAIIAAAAKNANIHISRTEWRSSGEEDGPGVTIDGEAVDISKDD